MKMDLDKAVLDAKKVIDELGGFSFKTPDISNCFSLLCEHLIERPDGARLVKEPIRVLEARAGLLRKEAEKALKGLAEQGYLSGNDDWSEIKILQLPYEETEATFPPSAPADVKLAVLPLDNLQDDASFKYRVDLKVRDLVKSIGKDGQQFPILVRGEKAPYQVISGFRRVAALKKLGHPTVLAIVRNDLDDNKAVVVSVLENEMRKSYNALDRGYAIIKIQNTLKITNEEAAKLFGKSSRQIERFRQLTTFPEDVQKAIAGDQIPATHALILMQYKAKDNKLDLERWLEYLITKKPNIRDLNKALRKNGGGIKEDGVFILRKDKDGKEYVRFKPIKVDQTAPDNQKDKIIKELQHIILVLKKWRG